MDSLLKGKVDLYGLLEVPPDASDQDIKTAYRKKALKVHPDKNPDNPEAAVLFHQLSEAFKILSDATAKKAYDQVLKAKKENELRDRKLDAKRKKLKDELEAREREAASGVVAKKVYEKSADELLRSELERLQKQGSQQLAEEQERIKQEIARERQTTQKASYVQSCKLKIKWKPTSGRDDYTQERLHNILHKYGDITALVISSKKGSAIVEFANRRDAELALSVERGLSTCPLKLSVVEGQSQPATVSVQEQRNYQGPVTATMEDFEDQVLRSMQAAQERKRKMGNNS